MVDWWTGAAGAVIGGLLGAFASLTAYLDGKVLEDARDAFDRAKLDPDRDNGVDLDRGDSMSAGEIDWLVLYPFKGRDEEDLRLIVAFHDFPIQLESVHSWHPDIKNHHIIRIRPEVLECFLGVIEGVYLYPLKLETLLDDFGDIGLVIDD